MTDDTELLADGDVAEAFLDDAVDAAEFLRLPGLEAASFGSSFPVPVFSEMSGTGGGVFPASNADLIALKFLDTSATFFGPELGARVADSWLCFVSKMEIRSEIGLLPD